jgi:hypothetical protein
MSAQTIDCKPKDVRLKDRKSGADENGQRADGYQAQVPTEIGKNVSQKIHVGPSAFRKAHAVRVETEIDHLDSPAAKRAGQAVMLLLGGKEDHAPASPGPARLAPERAMASREGHQLVKLAIRHGGVQGSLIRPVLI